jgi:hypothetical protein
MASKTASSSRLSPAVPYDTAPDTADKQRDYSAKLAALLAADRRDDALELFMRLAGSPDEQIQDARSSPMWPALRALAHTLAYDAACLRDRQPDRARLATLRQPTLVATGDNAGPFEAAADLIAAAIARGQRLSLKGQPHMVDPAVLAPALERFFVG